METYSYTFSFLSLGDSFDMNVSFKGEESTFQLIIDSIKLGIFSVNKVPDGKAYFMLTSKELIQNLEGLIDYLKIFNLVKLNQLLSWVNKLGDETYFTVVLNRSVSLDENIAIHAKLEELQNGVPFEENMNTIQEMTSSLFANYTLVAYDNKKRVCIGEAIKEKRICRYCKRMQADGAKFKKVGHTISEALGNKSIITNDECDDCNEFFGINIEPHFISFIDPLRVFFGVQGKGHPITKIQGGNYEISLDPSLKKEIHIKLLEQPDIDVNKSSFHIPLKHSQKVVPQNIYKSLVKYAFGVIPDDKLHYFDKTADWLLNNVEQKQLSFVRISYTNGYEPAPRIVLYLRKNDNSSLPFAIGEFHILNMIYLYLIPTFSCDETIFNDASKWNDVVDVCKYWKNVRWMEKDFSSLNVIEPRMTFQMEKRN